MLSPNTCTFERLGDTYCLGSVIVTNTLTIKDESNTVLGLSHPLGVSLLELGELGSTLDLEEDLVAIGVLDFNVELLTSLGLGLGYFGVGHIEVCIELWV